MDERKRYITNRFICFTLYLVILYNYMKILSLLVAANALSRMKRVLGGGGGGENTLKTLKINHLEDRSINLRIIYKFK
jgi:hypothetical protein